MTLRRPFEAAARAAWVLSSAPRRDKRSGETVEIVAEVERSFKRERLPPAPE